MRVLILGATGMLGSMLYFKFSTSSEFEVASVIRTPVVKRFKLNKNNIFDQNILKFDKILQAKILNFGPDAVINCIGSIKQKIAKTSDYILVNSYFPHLLDDFCFKENVRLVHFSSDCVFSGVKGMYLDDDPHDASDNYGKSKSMGELDSECSITLRTSMIGPQICSTESLLEWFLSQNGKVHGYANAFFSGLTTPEIAKVVSHLLKAKVATNGIYNLSMPRISKFDLLCQIARSFGLDTKITKSSLPIIDRSLNSDRLLSHLNYNMLDWHNSIEELKNEYLQYKGYYGV